MENFNILFDAKDGVVTIRYHNVTYYKTLLGSIRKLLDLKIPECTRIVLDFREVKFLFIAYHQFINFRHALSLLLPKKVLSKIAVINSPEAWWSLPICATSPILEKDFREFDMRCFKADEKYQAYQWIK